MRNGMQKRVRQVDIDTGEELCVYESISHAARDNWLEFSSLSRALKRNNGVYRRRRLKFEFIGD